MSLSAVVAPSNPLSNKLAMDSKTDTLNSEEKIKLYRFLIKHGFEPVENPNILENVLPGRSAEQVRVFLDSHKESSSHRNKLHFWVSRILAQRQYYNQEHLHTIFADMMTRKSETLSHNEDYKQVYLFLAKILSGEFPDIDSLSNQSITILLLLVQELESTVAKCLSGPNQQLSQSIGATLFQSTDQTTFSDDELQKRKECLDKIFALSKFQRIQDFMNPLRISPSFNQKVFNKVFKGN